MERSTSGDTDGYLHAIKPDSSIKWSKYVGSGVFSSPAIGIDETVYVGTNELYALKSGQWFSKMEKTT